MNESYNKSGNNKEIQFRNMNTFVLTAQWPEAAGSNKGNGLAVTVGRD